MCTVFVYIITLTAKSARQNFHIVARKTFLNFCIEICLEAFHQPRTIHRGQTLCYALIQKSPTVLHSARRRRHRLKALIDHSGETHSCRIFTRQLEVLTLQKNRGVLVDVRPPAASYCTSAVSRNTLFISGCLSSPRFTHLFPSLQATLNTL